MLNRYECWLKGEDPNESFHVVEKDVTSAAKSFVRYYMPSAEYHSEATVNVLRLDSGIVSVVHVTYEIQVAFEDIKIQEDNNDMR